MNAVVIVAIPSQQDPIWKESSEKVPHLTLLYLGEPGPDFDFESARQHVEHTIKSSAVSPFGMAVKRRGLLGDEDADVLFFDKSWVSKSLEDLRYQLKTNSHIKKACDAAHQYPEWMPHLTMGYPESPAKSSNLDYPISWVNFDTIAIWNEDYSGPEFILEDSRLQVEEVSMSDSVDNILAHYGVKGMKWGVRRSQAQIDADSDDVVQVKSATSKISTNRTTNVLTNKELQAVVNRMQLEANYSRLVSQSQQKSLGRKFVDRLVKNPQERKKYADATKKGFKTTAEVAALSAILSNVKLN